MRGYGKIGTGKLAGTRSFAAGARFPFFAGTTAHFSVDYVPVFLSALIRAIRG
jgi:hypothetical protein